MKKINDNIYVTHFQHEYPNSNEEQYKFIILTNYSKQELLLFHPEIDDKYSPYYIAPLSLAEDIAEYDKNEAKHKKRLQRNTIPLTSDTERLITTSVTSETIIIEMAEQEAISNVLQNVISKLTIVQQRRVKLHYYKNLSIAEIAALEGTTTNAVKESIICAKKRMKKILLERDFKCDPSSLAYMEAYLQCKKYEKENEND